MSTKTMNNTKKTTQKRGTVDAQLAPTVERNTTLEDTPVAMSTGEKDFLIIIDDFFADIGLGEVVRNINELILVYSSGDEEIDIDKDTKLPLTFLDNVVSDGMRVNELLASLYERLARIKLYRPQEFMAARRRAEL